MDVECTFRLTPEQVNTLSTIANDLKVSEDTIVAGMIDELNEHDFANSRFCNDLFCHEVPTEYKNIYKELYTKHKDALKNIIE